MKKILLALVVLSLSGCTYNIMNFEKTLKDVTVTQTTDKTVTTSPALQGNVPIQGGVVSQPAQTAK